MDDVTEITSTDLFKFVTDVFFGDQNDDLITALTVIMASVDEEDPKQIVRQFGIVVQFYQRFCVDKIATVMTEGRNKAISQLHEASIVAQGGS